MLRRVSLSLSVLWDLAAEYRGGRKSTVICFFPFSHCALGPYGGMWRRRLTPDSLMALPDVGTKVMETKREGSGVFLVTLFSLPVSSNHFRSHCGDTTFPLWCCLLYPDLSLLSAAPPLSDPHLGPWPSPPFPPAKEFTETKQEGSGGRNWNIVVTLSVFPFPPIIPAPSAVIPGRPSFPLATPLGP